MIQIISLTLKKGLNFLQAHDKRIENIYVSKDN